MKNRKVLQALEHFTANETVEVCYENGISQKALVITNIEFSNELNSIVIYCADKATDEEEE